MKRALLGGAVAMLTMVFAAPALANYIPPPPGDGYMELCKYSTTLSGTPSFTFDVSGLSTPVTVQNNSCTRPFPVPAGTVTVYEHPGAWYMVSAITTDPGSALVSSNPQGSGALDPGPNGTAKVTVTASGDPSTATIVNYTNVLVQGYVEVCKYNEPDAGLTGSWTFGLSGNNGFTDSVVVPIGHCSFPILVPAGVVTVTETPGTPTSVSSITVQNGAPSTTSLTTGGATVTVKPEPAPGDSSQEAMVNFFNDTVQLKICKDASDPGVTSPYTFTAVGTGDPTFPSGITKTVTMTPGTCQVVPGPYTNPNGTTGWRAGTKVTVSEGVVPGTAVTAITVIPSSREVAGAKVLTPLPNPTAPGPAGSDAAILGSGETTLHFTNDSEPGGKLKICEMAAGGLATGSPFTFTVSSPTPAGSTTTATVLAGSCTVVPNPKRLDGLWLFNSTVTITQTAVPGLEIVPPIAVSPSARLISQSGATVSVSIGSGDVTAVTYTNDPSGSGGGSPGPSGGSPGPSGGGSGGGSPGPSGGSPGPSGGGSGGSSPKHSVSSKVRTQLKSVRLLKQHGHHYLVVRVDSSGKTARVRIVELDKHGKKVKVFVVKVKTNTQDKALIPFSSHVRDVYARLA